MWGQTLVIDKVAASSAGNLPIHVLRVRAYRPGRRFLAGTADDESASIPSNEALRTRSASD